jgi:NAD(P)H-dependent flavin oxidoreductase YrpB (nitropropane dioxygenase family)
MKTAAGDRVGVEIPIVQAQMGNGALLATAVSNAGGLGTLPAWVWDIETLRAQIGETRALTSKPFAANFNMEFPQEERLDACLEEGAPTISVFWQDASPIASRAKDAGAIVMHTVASADDARRAVDWGADAVKRQ